MKYSLTHILLFLSAQFVNSSYSARAQETNGALSLNECISIALENNKKLQLSLLNVQSSEYQYELQRANLRPSLTNNSVYSMGSSFGANPNDATYSTALQFSQTLFAGGQNRLNSSAARKMIDLSRLDADIQTLTVKEEVSTGYLNIVAANEFYRLSQMRYELSNALYQEINARISVGLARKTDLYRLESELSLSKTQLEASTNNIGIEFEGLFSWMGGSNPFEVISMDSLVIQMDLAIPDDPQSTVLQNSPEWNSLIIQEEVNSLNVLIADRNRLPRIDAIANSGYGNIQSFDPDFFWSAGLSVAIPLYQGGNNRNNSKLRSIDLETTSKRKHDFLIDRYAQLKQLKYRRQNAENNIAVTQDQLSSARINLDLKREEYRNGLARLLDIMDAQSTYLQMEFNLLQARVDFVISTIQMQRLMGTL